MATTHTEPKTKPEELSAFDMVRRMDALQANQESVRETIEAKLESNYKLLEEKVDSRFARLEELIVELKRAQEKAEEDRKKAEDKRDDAFCKINDEITRIKTDEIGPLKGKVGKHDEKFRNNTYIIGSVWTILLLFGAWLWSHVNAP